MGEVRKIKSIRLGAIRLAADGGCMGVCSISSDDKDHPNKLPFKGTLLLLDEASNKPPHGARGHRILVPKDVAQDRLNSLIGQGINYDPGNLDEHVPRHKVGVINGARIVGNKVIVYGSIWAKDFPEAVKQLHGRKDLGMSMELANVYVKNADADVWRLNDFEFTGATILKKSAAAYTNTELAARASHAATAPLGEGESRMSKQAKKVKVIAAAGEEGTVVTLDSLAASIASAVGNAVKEANKDLVSLQAKSNAKLTALASSMSELQGLILQSAAEEADDDTDIQAAKYDDDDMDAAKHDDDDDDDDDDMDAAKSKHDDDDDDDDDSEDDQDASDLDAELEDLEDKAPHSEPGKVNHAMKTKGNKTTTTDVGAEGEKGGLVKASSIQAAAAVISTLKAANKKLRKQMVIQASEHKKAIKKLNRNVQRMDAQLQAAAEQTSRRTVIPVDLAHLAAKSNIDLGEIQASGTKMSVEQVDQMFASAGFDIDPTTRMAMKNKMLEMGLMEQGEITRYAN